MDVSIRRLRYFQTIASEGSFSAAARRLNIAQPALSHHIRQMEDGFGAALLSRTNRGIGLTEAGQVLRRHAAEILQRIEDADAEVRTLVREPHGTVSVALAGTLARQMAPRVLTMAAERCPKVHVKILVIASDDAVQLVASESIDLAIIPIAAQIPDVEARPIYRENACFTRLATGKPNRNPIRFHELAGVPLVQSSSKYDLRRRLDDLATNLGVALDIRYEQDSGDVMLAIALSGVAGFITQTSVYHPVLERPLIDARPIIAPEIVRTHCIVRPQNRPMSLSLQATEDVLTSCIKQMTESGELPGIFVDEP